MKKYLITSLILFVSLFSLIVYQRVKFDDGKTHIIFCNVGQGDGILIRTPKGLSVLEDAGPDSSILGCLSRHTPFWDRTIELAVLSHPHLDHMAGMISILNDYKVLSYATEELRNNTSIYNKLEQILKNDNLKPRFIYSGDSFQTPDGVVFKILGPSRDFLTRANPSGIVGESKESGSLSILISKGNFNAILTGDTPIEELNQTFGNFSLPKIDIFQIPHHGSFYNTNEEVLRKVSPKFAVVSVGKNSYGHPSPQILNLLKNLRIPFLRTDQHGDIDIVSDGDGFKIN